MILHTIGFYHLDTKDRTEVRFIDEDAMQRFLTDLKAIPKLRMCDRSEQPLHTYEDALAVAIEWSAEPSN